MDGLTGLQPLDGPVRLLETAAESQATPEDRSGDPADPRHGQWGQQARPYPWQSSMMANPGGGHGPYGPENAFLDDDYWAMTPAGNASQDDTMDKTPSTRGGPSPKGVLSGPIPGDGPDDIAEQLQQSMAIHGIRTNAGVRALVPPQALGIQNDTWVDFWEMNPGETMLQPLSRQQMGSSFVFGSRDRTQTFARQNEYSFDSAHMHRRWATGSIPGNTYWMRPGGRPLVKNIPTVARAANGPTSPFAGDDTMYDFTPYGAVLLATPTEYTPPPQPNLIAANYSGPAADVEFY
jgi:hypothetical protein